MQPIKGVTNVKFKEEVNIALSKVRLGQGEERQSGEGTRQVKGHVYWTRG